MAPRVPKKAPKWLALLFDHLSRRCGDDEARHFYDSISAQAEAQWAEFCAAHEPPVPRVAKTQDPGKALERTLKRYNDAVESAPRRNRRKLVEDFSEQLQNLNPVLRDALSEVAVGGGGSGRGSGEDGDNGAQENGGGDGYEQDNGAEKDSNVPQRIRVRRPRRAPLVERTEELFGTFRAEAQDAGIGDDHPMYASVEQLVGLARELIDASCAEDANN